MKTYNRALDYVAIAMDQHSKGRVKTAAKAFASAMTSPDVKAALAILEASNAQAFKAKLEAKVSTKVSVEAKAEIKQLARLFGDNEELNAAAFGEEPEPEGEPEKVEDEAVEDEDKEDDAFASALAALQPKKK